MSGNSGLKKINEHIKVYTNPENLDEFMERFIKVGKAYRIIHYVDGPEEHTVWTRKNLIDPDKIIENIRTFRNDPDKKIESIYVWIPSDSKNNVLLAGNGINISNNNCNSWNNLIKQLYEREYKIDYKLIEDLEFIDQYEYLVDTLCKANKKSKASYLTKDKDVRIKLKEKTVTVLDQMEVQEFHKKALNYYDEILTTNYDFLFEKAYQQTNPQCQIDVVAKTEGDDEETSLYRKVDLNGKTIWHIHGAESEINGKHSFDSICFDRLMYTKNLTAMVNGIQSSNTLQKNSWAKIIMEDNVDIIGHSLGKSELDLMWILTYRGQLSRSEENLIKNEIRYFYIVTDEVDSESNRKELNAKLCFLASIGVTTVGIQKNEFKDDSLRNETVGVLYNTNEYYELCLQKVNQFNKKS